MTELRPVRPEDLPAVLALNEAAVPAVSSVDLDWFTRFAELATRFTVITDEGEVVAFLLGLSGPGLDYPSPNYRWFSEHLPDGFLYVDRVVVHPDRWSEGLGRRLYDDLVEHAGAGHPVLAAEVNVRPRNERSLEFHRRYGFVAVGEQETYGGRARVALMTLDLAADDDDERAEVAALEQDLAVVERLLDHAADLSPAETERLLSDLER